MMNVTDDAQALITTIERDNPDVVNLARAVSLAVRVEPELLRRVRLKMLPHVQAGAEADLWFSPLVQSQTPLWIVLLPEVAGVLRRRLAEDQKELEKAWQILREFRVNASPTITLEEEVTWLALSEKQDAAALIQKRLEEVLVSLTNENRPGLAHWAVRALPLFPATARSSQAARVISVIAGAQIGKPQILEENPPSNVLKKWLRLAAPKRLRDSSIGVRLLERVEGGAVGPQRAVEFSDPPALESHEIAVPKTDPFLLEVTWEDQSGQHHEQVSLPALQTITCNVGAGQIKIRTALGETHLLLPVAATEDSPESSSEANALPDAVPRARHPLVERRSLIEEIKKEFSVAKQPVVLWGAAGCGKTTLAAEVARELVSTYRQRIVWINPQAHVAFGLPTMLNEIASQLGRADLRRLSLEGAKREGAVRALIVQSPVLIVLDGLESVPSREQARCLRFLNQLSYPVLITSRQRVSRARTITVTNFSRKQAYRFLDLMNNGLRFKDIPRDAREDTYLSYKVTLDTAAGNPFLMQWLLALFSKFGSSVSKLLLTVHARKDIASYVFEQIPNLQPLEETLILMALTFFIPDAPRDAVEKMVHAPTSFLGRSILRLQESRFIRTTADGRRLAVEGLMRELAGRYLDAKRSGVRAKGGDFNFDSESMSRAFVEYYVGFAEAHGELSEQNFDALEAEKENLLNAVGIASGQGDWEKVLRLGRALAPKPGTGFLYQRDYWDEALAVNEQASHAAQRNRDEAAQAELPLHAAYIHQQRAEWELAMGYCYRSMTVARKHDDREGVATCLYQMARIWRTTGDNKMAEKFYRQSLKYYEGLKSASMTALVTYELGSLAHQQGNRSDARRLYLESLRLWEKADLPDSIINRARATLDLGILAHETGLLGEARVRFEHSLKLLEGAGDQQSIAVALHELGRLALTQERLTDAGRYFNRSLEIDRELADQRGIARNLSELGRLKQASGDQDAAKSLYLQSLNIQEALEDKHGTASTLLQLGALSLEAESLPEAQAYFQESLRISQEMNDERTEAQAHFGLGIVASRQGNLAVAVKLLRATVTTFKRLKLPPESVQAELSAAETELKQKTPAENRFRKAAKRSVKQSHSAPGKRVASKKSSPAALRSKSSSMPSQRATRTSSSKRLKTSARNKIGGTRFARAGSSKGGSSARRVKLAKK
jgi:tetratricopeptide (TPR) repeat protein